MERYIALFLIAGLCVCLAGCVARQESVQTTAPSFSGLMPEAPDPSTESAGIPEPGITVTPPEQMPEKPEADYTLPPGEKPAEQGNSSKY